MDLDFVTCPQCGNLQWVQEDCYNDSFICDVCDKIFHKEGEQTNEPEKRIG